MNLESEIKQVIALCDKNGNLNPSAIGWSRKPLHRCNLSKHYFRKKKWNYWCIYDKEWLISFTISDVDYAGLIFGYYLEFSTGKFAEFTKIVPFSSGITMGQQTDNNARYQSGGLSFDFQAKKHGQMLLASIPDIGGENLNASIDVEIPEDLESMNVVIPWSKRRFQFTSKQIGLAASGTVTIGTRSHTFNKADTFACLDFGRGVWPYNITWNWGVAVSRSDGDIVGANMGAKWTDNSGYTENSILAGGKTYKLPENVLFEYDRKDFMKPWKIRTEQSSAIDFEFTPFFDRHAKSNLVILASDVHQMIGKYKGEIKIGRKTVAIHDAIGWAEDHIARW